MRIYIGNLPYAMSEGELEYELAKFGPVDRVHIALGPGGESRGIAFATMRDTGAAIAAGAFNYLGRRLYIKPALDRHAAAR